MCGYEMGSTLLKLRVDMNLTQAEAAKELGLTSPRVLDSWEKNESEPSIRDFIKVCGLYGIENASYFESGNEAKNRLKKEALLLAKLRQLDEAGYSLIEFAIAKEWERSYYVPKIVCESDEIEGLSLLIGYLSQMTPDALDTIYKYAEQLEDPGNPDSSSTG
ncbi:MAG: helix-turn-helix domain-containing protein [Eubacteriaceae bacterium]|jgi:transcriptional regulator with XRE-family HTH domain|nr:helix-turn-helix domain-containing protein [Eubacteriaceae bacterium]